MTLRDTAALICQLVASNNPFAYYRSEWALDLPMFSRAGKLARAAHWAARGASSHERAAEAEALLRTGWHVNKRSKR